MPQQGIDFEYCAVQQTETRSFTLSNTSASLVHFEVQMDDANAQSFEISPRTGKLSWILLLLPSTTPENSSLNTI